ncbi:MAG: AAA family ATPase [Bacteroidales bacterium]|nr:AAA family ATPase [Bacteroidales bacterium]
MTIRRTTEKVISKVEVSEEEAFKMLGTAYIAHIHERNMAYKYDKATFDALKSAAKWASDPKAKNSLLIVGGVGTGKTTLAKALCDVLNAEYKFRYDGCFAASFKTVSAIELTAAARNDNEKFEMYKECMRLFIDDFGTEPDSVKIFGNTLSPMTELLYRR